jgi:glycerol-3-phosphate acyltransferase PlsY
MKLAFCLLLAYLLGGVPFGLIVSNLTRGVDIRRLGSGNIGATNVLRVIGWKAGLLVLLLDVVKGFIPVILTRALLFPNNPLIAILAGMAAMLGHTFSPFLRFTGGRAVAAGLGVMLALSWKAAGSGFAVAFLLIFAFRYVSIGSIVGSASLPVFMTVFNEPREYILFSLLAAALIVLRHVPNIKRLLEGTESKIGIKKKDE